MRRSSLQVNTAANMMKRVTEIVSKLYNYVVTKVFEFEEEDLKLRLFLKVFEFEEEDLKLRLFLKVGGHNNPANYVGVLPQNEIRINIRKDATLRMLTELIKANAPESTKIWANTPDTVFSYARVYREEHLDGELGEMVVVRRARTFSKEPDLQENPDNRDNGYLQLHALSFHRCPYVDMALIQPDT